MKTQSIKKFKICRRLGPGVYEKCQTSKFTTNPKAKFKKALSTFGYQMIEKQKMKFSYGLRERQFSNYIKKALDSKKTTPKEFLLSVLEGRLDNVVYRMGIAPTRRMARQLVNHGHFTVNGRKVNIPSFAVDTGDVVSIREGSRKSPAFSQLETKLKQYKSPGWVAFEPGKLEGRILNKPTQVDDAYDVQSVLEFYSR